MTLILNAADLHGQYYDGQTSQQSGINKLPLNQLPPIVSSDQVGAGAAGKSKGLFIPPNVGNLPPIVSPPQYKAPFVYGQSNNNRTQPQATPSFSPPANNPSNGVGSGLPPIIQSNSAGQRSPLPAGTPSRPAGLPTRSTAGVPIYPNSGSSFPPPVPQRPASSQLLPAKTSGFGLSTNQGSDSRNVPSIQAPTDLGNPFGTPSAPQARSVPFPPEFSNSLSPVDQPSIPSLELDNAGGSVVDSPIINNSIPATAATRGFPVPQNAPGTNNYFEQPAQAQHTPSNGVNTGCSSCGPGGCYDPAQVQSQNSCCGSVVNAGYYGFADALFWTRGDGDVQLSNSFGLTDFNFVGGYRFTLGYRENATRGRELTIFGTGELDESEFATSPAGNLNALFTSTIAAAGFFNAVSQTQEKSSQLFSAEYNRINWGWDVLKTFAGIRYIYFDDSFSLFSTNGGGTNAFFAQDSVNNLFGVHGGGELFYDVGFRTSASLTAKFGGYVNAANVDTNVFNAGTQVLSQETDEGAIASTIEIGAMSHFQLSPQSRFRLGYDLFLLWGAFTVENNIPRDTFTGTPVLNAATGTNLNTNNEPVFLHGISFGFEVFR